MKKTAWAALLSAVFLLAGCGASEERSAARASSNSPAAQAESGDLTAAEEFSSGRFVTEEEILCAFQRAEEAYGWFDLSPLPDDGETLSVDGVEYRRVTAPGMGKLEDLRTYLRSVFTSELTERLLTTGDSTPLYREIDGVLYVSAGGRAPTPGKGDMEIRVNSADDGSYLVEVNVDLLSEAGEVVGLECWSFPYAFVDGRWVFTDFWPVY